MREYRVCRVGVPIWIELETIEQLEAPECGRVLGEITQQQKDIYAVLGSENPRYEFQEFKVQSGIKADSLYVQAAGAKKGRAQGCVTPLCFEQGGRLFVG